MINNILKKNKLVLVTSLLLTVSYGCTSYLDVDQFTKVSEDHLLSYESGINVLVANLYNSIPMEDFNYMPQGSYPGFNQRGYGDDAYYWLSMYTDESQSSAKGRMGTESYNVWGYGWPRNREVNVFLAAIEKAKDKGSITEDTYFRLWSEANFVRAYLYFAMAKRYGGLPIIDFLQDNDFLADPETVFIPRSTESDTWKFVLECCDNAAKYLPEPAEMTDGNPMWRANKWAAYALKSRVALYAASIAKFGDKLNFVASDPAVSQKLAGIDASEANFFYNECLVASKKIIDESLYGLYMPDPATPRDAAINYQNLFMNGQNCGIEIIFGRTFMDGGVYPDQGHGFDHWTSPIQTRIGGGRCGRFSITLDIVDLYEDYTDDGTGQSAHIITRTDGNESFYFNSNTPDAATVCAIPFKTYDDPYDAFKDKDARLLASVIVPNSMFKGTKIVMQGGIIKTDGTFSYLIIDSETVGDVTYFAFGADNDSQYSGFSGISNQNTANYSNTGFLLRKYLGEDKSVAAYNTSCTTPWLDFRLAEIYLNYAEAAIESGQGDAGAAAGYLNAIRKRAGHKDLIPLSVETVQKERRIELAFENHRYWDLLRRREYHSLFNGQYRRKSLVQMIDLRGVDPKYVFLRVENFRDILDGTSNFSNLNNYYESIPGTNVNRLINNPGRN